MADRTVYGLNFSENGWRMVDQGSCVWVRVPGATHVSLQIREGQPALILGAFAADFNAHVEPLRDADSAAWTATNNVASSNHLSGTAMDLNWNGADGKTFRLGISQAVAYPGDKAHKLLELLDFYEGLVFCGGFWSIQDWMHFQMGGNTYGSQHVGKVNNFIARKIRPDGFSTFKRAAIPIPPPTFPPPADYGLPRGTRINYGAPGFPDWVYQLAKHFNVRASTYPGHQESNRNEAGYAPNPAQLNRGIDWAGSVADMQRLADYLSTIPGSLEQVIWQNPHTGRSIEIAGGRHQPGYFAADLAGHRDHVHTRQSRPLPLPGGTPPAPPPQPHRGAEILSRAMGASVPLDRYRQLWPSVAQALDQSMCDTVNRIAMWLAQIGHESAGLKYMEEIADGSAYEGRRDLGNTQPGDGRRYKGRGPIQITGRHNYTQLSAWAHSKGFVPTPTFFVDHPHELASDRYGFLGVVWYWTVARPQINAMADRDDLEGVTRAINGGLNGLADRRTRWERCRSMAADLPLIKQAPSEGDDMALVPQDQWDRVYRELTQRYPSRSPLRHLGEGLVDTAVGFVLNADSSQHVEIVKLLASLGHPPSLALLHEVAGADPNQYPDRQEDRLIAQAILADIRAKPTNGQAATHVNAAANTRELDAAYAENARLREENARLLAEASRVPAMVELDYLPAVPEQNTGEIIGELYQALAKLRLADALPIESRAPLAALIKVLETKNGAQLS